MSRERKSELPKEKIPEKSAGEFVGGSMESPSQKEDNLRRLVESGILVDFVKKNNGSWDHSKWLGLCDEISVKGYLPIDLDQVGLALEQEKSFYFRQK
ncbi:MAG: hypothetical protein A2101_02210 [Spirochaetes bacterium GWF2_52_7]|nr:MAG: hypothetical protein A2101_02210 [Spirochaetes bacterium GWF2_52_7]